MSGLDLSIKIITYKVNKSLTSRGPPLTVSKKPAQSTPTAVFTAATTCAEAQTDTEVVAGITAVIPVSALYRSNYK